MSAEHTARAWRTALDPHGDWIPAVLTAAHTRLGQLRASGVPDAGGLVIATDHADYAEWIAEILATQNPERVHIVPATTAVPVSSSFSPMTTVTAAPRVWLLP